MKILICPDSFKGTFSAAKAGKLIEKGVKKAAPMAKTEIIPLADGGEGTLNVLISFLRIYRKKVAGPLGRQKKVSARYGIMKNHKVRTALIETSDAAGLNLIPENKRNPLYTTTYGVGELIISALDKGCKKIILAIGGSSTNDAGIGMAQALGVKFYDQDTEEIKFSKKTGYCGKALSSLHSINLSEINPRVKECKFTAISDVQNPLYGKEGAAYVYALQKGASVSEVKFLDGCLKNFSKVVKKSLGKDISKLKGGGAAGGLSAGLNTFIDAKIISGIDFIMDILKLEKHIEKCDVIITGEGCIDSQTFQGKTISGILSAADKYRKPVIAISGCLGIDHDKLCSRNISVIVDSSKGIKKPLSYFKKNPGLISKAAYNAFNQWRNK